MTNDNVARKNNLNIIQHNIHSLSANKDEMQMHLERENIDIALLSETWLGDEISLKFKNHNILNIPRADEYGGVGILLRKEIKYKQIQLDIKPIECIVIQTTNLHTNLLLC